MQLPENASQPRRTDNTSLKALARALRWKRMLESGEYATIAQLAEREGIATSYMTRVLRLMLLAPDFVEAILDGKQRSLSAVNWLIDDRGYDADWFRDALQNTGIRPVQG